MDGVDLRLYCLSLMEYICIRHVITANFTCLMKDEKFDWYHLDLNLFYSSGITLEHTFRTNE